MVKKKNKKIGIIIQARISSSRLPGKVLKKISGRQMLWHIIERLGYAEMADEIILAIPDNKKNDRLEDFAEENNISFFRGSENDVLSRYFNAAEKFKCDIIVRITADCALIDPKIIDSVIKEHLRSGADCTSNVMERTFPRGLDVEVINSEVLEKIYKQASDDHFREHVTPYIYSNPGIFKIKKVEAKGKLYRPDLKWAVDEGKDLEMVRKIYQKLYRPGEIFYSEDVIDLLEKRPEIKEINADVKQKSYWNKIS